MQLQNGGEDGIRTHGPLARIAGFQDQFHKPLGHLSKAVTVKCEYYFSTKRRVCQARRQCFFYEFGKQFPVGIEPSSNFPVPLSPGSTAQREALRRRALYPRNTAANEDPHRHLTPLPCQEGLQNYEKQVILKLKFTMIPPAFLRARRRKRQGSLVE